MVRLFLPLSFIFFLSFKLFGSENSPRENPFANLSAIIEIVRDVFELKDDEYKGLFSYTDSDPKLIGYHRFDLQRKFPGLFDSDEMKRGLDNFLNPSKKDPVNFNDVARKTSKWISENIQFDDSNFNSNGFLEKNLRQLLFRLLSDTFSDSKITMQAFIGSPQSLNRVHLFALFVKLQLLKNKHADSGVGFQIETTKCDAWQAIGAANQNKTTKWSWWNPLRLLSKRWTENNEDIERRKTQILEVQLHHFVKAILPDELKEESEVFFKAFLLLAQTELGMTKFNNKIEFR